ncbi:MAG: sulfite exporter TauE/SafE family protein [Proteobacteria bacterium]|nr:sulfite exporter TauE/SafE family protein [Pseudomonadota bacterium]
MELTLILAVQTAFVIAAFLKGVTGLGFSTLCLGMIASFVDIRLSIPLVILPSLTSNVLVMIDAGHFRSTFRRFMPMFACALPGLLMGLWLLDNLPGERPRFVLGFVLASYGVWGLFQGVYVLPGVWQRRLMGPVGLVTGVINGLTGSQIMPILPYLLSLGLSKDIVVQAINTSFTISSLVMLVGLGKLGLLSTNLLLVSAAGILPVALGIRLGGRVRRRVSEARFRVMVLWMLVLLGASLIVRSWGAF